jgi:hypothetical protein
VIQVTKIVQYATKISVHREETADVERSMVTDYEWDRVWMILVVAYVKVIP